MLLKIILRFSENSKIYLIPDRSTFLNSITSETHFDLRTKVFQEMWVCRTIYLGWGFHEFLNISVVIDRHNFAKPATSFRMYYDRGDLPIKMEYLIGGDKISWTVDIDKLDYSLYLPLFFDGLSETQHPYKTFARQGVQDLLSNGGDKIYAIIPQLIIPIKSALNTKNIEVMCTTLKIIQQLVNASDLIGPGLVPFYRQLLPVFNAYKIRNSKLIIQ